MNKVHIDLVSATYKGNFLSSRRGESTTVYKKVAPLYNCLFSRVGLAHAIIAKDRYEENHRIQTSFDQLK